MPVRETLEQGTIKSRWSPISHSDLSISRPAPLISVLSSTTVLQVISKTHKRISNRLAVGNQSSPARLTSTNLRT